MSNYQLSPLASQDLEHALNLVDKTLWEQIRGKRLLLTGGTGFVGKWILYTLAEAQQKFDLNCDVVVLTRDFESFERQLPHLTKLNWLHFVKGDVRTFEGLDGEFQSVIHGATDVIKKSSPIQTFDTCYAGTRNVLEFAVRSGSKNFILISSGAVYGKQPAELVKIPEYYSGSSDFSLPESAYSIGKRSAEWISNAFFQEFEIRVVTARLFSFIGPYLALDKQFAIGNFIESGLKGLPITIKSDGTAVRSYLYAADMAGWLWNIFFKGQAGAAYNVGSDTFFTITELAELVKQLTGSKGDIQFMGSTRKETPSERYVPDVSRVRNELGLQKEISLHRALERTIEWYRSNNV